MNGFQEQDVDSVSSSITAIRQAWLDAVLARDAERLAGMVTDDVVVVHGNGRCIHGTVELKADFLKGFDAFSIEQHVSAAQVVVRGDWAFEIAEVHSTLTPRCGGEATHVLSTTVTALSRCSDGSWKVARVLGLLPSKHALSRDQAVEDNGEKMSCDIAAETQKN
jgi:uncharacterized protein (TIGR02246 family)